MPIWNFHLKLRSKHSADLKLWSKHNEKNADLSTARGTPIQAWREERQSKHTDPPQVLIWNSDPSTARRTPIQARREERRSKHGERNSDPSTTRRAPIQAHQSATSANLLLSVSVGVSVCGCIWFCGVYGWFCCWFCGWFLIFVVDFWLSVGVCVSEEAALVVQMEKREKKRSEIRNY